MKNNNLLIGWSESLGFTYRYKNKSRRCIQDYILEDLKEMLEKNEDVTYLNFFSMLFNKSWHIQSILENNLTIEEIKLLKRYGNDFSRRDLFTKLGIPKKLGYLEEIGDGDKDIHIRNLIKDNACPLIFYDAGINDFMYHFNNSFFVATIEAKHSMETVSRMLKNEYLDTVVNSVANNIDTMLKINPNSKIFIFGFSLLLYTPSFPYHIYKHIKAFQEVGRFIERFNHELSKLERPNSVYFIDTATYKNKKKTSECISKYIFNQYMSCRNKTVAQGKQNKFRDEGILGMISDTKKRIKDEEHQLKILYSTDTISKINGNKEELILLESILELRNNYEL